MKKIIILIMSFVFVFSMTGCTSEEPKVEKPSFEFGTVDENSYYNDYLGLGVTLGEDWSFHSLEQIKEVNGIAKDLSEEDEKKEVKSLKLIVDMLAINSDSSNISVMLEKADPIEIEIITSEKMLNNISDGMLDSLNDSGATDIKEEREEIKIGEKDAALLKITAKLPSPGTTVEEVFIAVAAFKCEEYIGCISISTYDEDKTSELLSLFYTEKPSDVLASDTTDISANTTSPETTPETEIETSAETEEPTPSEHSLLYIPWVSVDDMIKYFNEVVLDAEFSDSQDVCFVQKWVSPIRYIIKGEFTQEDRIVFDDFCAFLNRIEGFPGISEGTEQNFNMTITFGTNDELISVVGETFNGNDGYVTFWFNGFNELYKAEIYYRTDVDQLVRNSVIMEELYNGMGPIQDTFMREDSIIYSGFTTPQTLSRVDEVILQLLYHPDIKCGMNASQCEEVIRSLYY